MWYSLQRDKISQYWEYNIEALSEWLGSLQITEKASERTTEYDKEILTVLVTQNIGQVELPKSMIPDSG